MEDCNMLGADCVVISCCCQCLILQILLFVLLKLPYKLVRKTRRYVKSKFCGRKRNHNRRVHRDQMGSNYRDVLVRIHEQSIRLEAEMMMDIRDNGLGKNCGSCMDEVEKVMEEFYENGELAFGSFWGRKVPWGFPTTIVTNDHNYGDGFVRYQIIDLVGSSSLGCA